MTERLLIVNADDFGQSAGINRGVIEAFERGIVTSASLMVRWPAAAEAAAYAGAHPRLSLGLHLDLGEWAYGDGAWRALYQVVPLNDAQAVRDEAQRQLEAFRRLLGRHPTHIDSHQHVHKDEPVRSIMLDIAARLSLPLRHEDARVYYCGDFYGQSAKGYACPEHISVDALVEILRRLPQGITELGCHPGEAGDLETMYRDERATELSTLCDERLRAALAAEGIKLCSFRALNNAPPVLT
ncbi:MAG TPA: ChbG/HpnK family deacetylase [Blastocatellia bacterium]|nr:ChbG/HpnK family deacetylase [Blastocatellia bacterium]